MGKNIFLNVKFLFLNVRMSLFCLSPFLTRHSFTTFHELEELTSAETRSGYTGQQFFLQFLKKCPQKLRLREVTCSALSHSACLQIQVTCLHLLLAKCFAQATLAKRVSSSLREITDLPWGHRQVIGI